MLGYLGQAIILTIGGTMVLHHSLSLGALVAFFLSLNRFFQPITLLVQQYNTYQQGQASVVKLNTLLSLAPSVPEDADATDLPPIEGAVRCDHVTSVPTSMPHTAPVDKCGHHRRDMRRRPSSMTRRNASSTSRSATAVS